MLDYSILKDWENSLIWQILELILQQMSRSPVYRFILTECSRSRIAKYPEVTLPDFSFDRQQDPGEQFGLGKSRCQDLKIVVLSFRRS